MIRDSFIINKLIIIFRWIKELISRSFIYDLFNLIGRFFEKLEKNSIILNTLSYDTDMRFDDNSGVFVNVGRRFISFISSLLVGIKQGNPFSFKESFIVSHANENMLTVLIYFLIFLIPFAPTVILAFIAMAIIALYILNIFMGRIKFKNPTVLGFMTGLFLLCYVIGVVTSLDFSNALKTAVIFVPFAIMAFIIPRVINTEKKIDFSLNLIVISGVLVSLYGIFQYFSGVEMDLAWIDEKAFSEISIRVYSTFNNPNVLGEYLIIIASLALGMVWKSKKSNQKLLYLAAAGINLICLFMTSSRGSMVGLLIAIAIFVLVAEKRFIILGIIGVMMLPFVLPDNIWQRLLSVVNMSDTSSLYRISIYKASLNIIGDYWLTGIGVSAFNRIYPIYSYSAAYAYHSHNIFLQVFIELGIAGFISFLLMNFAFMQKMYSNIRKNLNRYKFVTAALLGGFVGLLFQGLADNLWFDYSIVLLFFTVIGIGSSLTDMKGAENSEKN